MIVSLDIERSDPLLDGMPFGAVGAYKKITGVAQGELDPDLPENSIIADLRSAPRNANGKVAYQTQFFILCPVDAARGSGCLLYEVNNRGHKRLFRRIADAANDSNDFLSMEDCGNAFPLRRGYTVVWSGWDPTAPQSDGRLTMTTPIASEGGRSFVDRVRDEFAVGIRPRSGETLKLSYEVADLDPAKSRLTVRSHRGDVRREIPRDRWEFADSQTVRLLPAGTQPQLGALYEIHYLAKNSPLLGIGFAATRDIVSYLRFDPAALAVTGQTIHHALAIGFSQSGRYLRNHVFLGFNEDESGRRVFDGVLAHTSGCGRVFLNARFAQPFRTCTFNEDHDFCENMFPFSAAASLDPITGKSGALLRSDASDPLFMQTNTSTEYWQKGASLVHTDALGERDLDLPPNVRAYLIAGTQHGGRGGVTSKSIKKAVHPNNPHSPMPILRALLVALEEWVVSGKAPPPSRIPTIADKNLVDPKEVGFPEWSGMSCPRTANQFGPLTDWVHPTAAQRSYRTLVCQVNADGNEIAGVRTPDIAVPLGTYTGWNLYKKPFPEGILSDRDGSFIEFAATRADGERTRDPRQPLSERYPDRSDYVARVRKVAMALVDARLLLPEDEQAYIERAQAESRISMGRS